MMELSLTRMMNWLASGGSTRLVACGSTTKRNSSSRFSPIELAASR